MLLATMAARTTAAWPAGRQNFFSRFFFSRIFLDGDVVVVVF